MKNFIIKNRIFRKITVAAIWILIWQLICIYVDNGLLIVSPIEVVERLMELIFVKDFWIAIFSSIYRVISGFFIALVLGVVLAILTTRIAFLYDLFYPIIGIIKATPVASFIILTHVWLKSNEIIMFMSFLMVLPIVWANIFEGIEKTDKKLLEMASVFKLSTFKVVQYIYVPSIMPYFMAAFTTGLGLAWKSGIAAEVITTPKPSIGSNLYNSKIYLDTVGIFVFTTVIIILSLFIEKTLTHIIKNILYRKFLWHKKSE